MKKHECSDCHAVVETIWILEEPNPDYEKEKAEPYDEEGAWRVPRATISKGYCQACWMERNW